MNKRQLIDAIVPVVCSHYDDSPDNLDPAVDMRLVDDFPDMSSATAMIDVADEIILAFVTYDRDNLTSLTIIDQTAVPIVLIAASKRLPTAPA